MELRKRKRTICLLLVFVMLMNISIFSVLAKEEKSAGVNVAVETVSNDKENSSEEAAEVLQGDESNTVDSSDDMSESEDADPDSTGDENTNGKINNEKGEKADSEDVSESEDVDSCSTSDEKTDSKISDEKGDKADSKDGRKTEDDDSCSAGDENADGKISDEDADGKISDENVENANDKDVSKQVSSYTISITLPEEGVKTAENSGELTQTVSAGSAMTDIFLISVYEDEPFDESYADAFNTHLFEDTGLTANCDEDSVITIGGTPTADVTVNLTDTFAENEAVTIEEGSAVYVSSSGNDTSGDGTEDKPYATISKAYSVVEDKGTIYLLSDLEISGSDSTAGITFGTDKTVTITSADSSDIKTIYSKCTGLGQTNSMMLVTKGEVIFTNITLDGEGQKRTDGYYQCPGCIHVSADGSAVATLDTGTTITGFQKDTGSSGGCAVLNAKKNGGSRINIKDGVLITNCKLTSGTSADPAAVMCAGSGAIMYMTGGEVTGNTLSTSQTGTTAVVNIGQYNNPHFWMIGGEITGNTINNGCAAVYMRGEASACDIEFGDTAYVYDNYVSGTSGDQRNVYLKNNNSGTENSKVYVKLCSALDDSAKLGVYAEMIGVATKVAQGGGVSGVGTGSYDATAADATYFVSDKETGAEILYCGGSEETCGLLQHRTGTTHEKAIYLSSSPAVTATKNTTNNDQLDLSIARCTSDTTFVVLDKDMKPVTGKTISGGSYVSGGNGTFKLTNSTSTTTIDMEGLEKDNGPYTVMRGTLSVDSTTGKADTSSLTDIATVNIVNFAGDGVTWSDDTNSFENGDFDIVTVPHNDQTGKAKKKYTATTKTGYVFTETDAISGKLDNSDATALTIDATKDVSAEEYSVSVTVPDYGTTAKGTSGYNTVTLTGKTKISIGVKLLDKTGGEEMTAGKTYDGIAVAYTAGSVDGATLSYTWQKKNAAGTYSNIEGNTAPSDAGEYNLEVKATKTDGTEIGTENLPFTISPKTLTVTATASDKVYDGTAKATVTNITMTGAVGDDKVALNESGMTAAFEDANAGTGKTVTVSGLSLDNNDNGNYKLPDTITTTANITKADGSGTIKLDGWTYGDEAKTPTADSTTNPGSESSPITYQYKTKDAEDGTYADTKPTDAGEYTVKATFPANDNYTAITATANFTISPKELTVNVKAEDKVYDGKADASLSTATLDGVETADTDKVTLVTSGVSAAFNNKNAGTDKIVTISGDYTLSGDAAKNYTVTQPTGLKANITAAPLTITGATVTPKIYDGNNNATITGVTFDGLKNGEMLTADEDYTVSDAKYDGVNATGSDAATKVEFKVTLNTSGTAANYSLTPIDGSQSATIGKASHANSTLDTKGNRGETNTFGDVSAYVVATGGTVGSSITVSDTNGILDGTPTYDNSTGKLSYKLKSSATDGQTATVTLTVIGANYNDYNIVVTVGVTSKETVEIGITGEDYVYDGAAHAPTGITVTEDKVSVSALEVSYKSKDGMTYTESTTAPTNAGKYIMTVKVPDSNTKYTGSATCAFEIKPKELTAAITAEDKTYDGNTTSTVTTTLNGVVESDSSNVTAVVTNPVFEDKNAGDNKKVTASIKLEGAAAGNYTVNDTAKTKASIFVKEVSIIGVTIDTTKVYDGNTTARITNSGELIGVISGDTVTIKTGTASYNDKDVGQNKTITFSGFELEGADADNYTLKEQPADTVAAITQREVAIAGTTTTRSSRNRSYYGNTTSEVTTEQDTAGVVGTGNNPTLDTTGVTASLNTKEVGENELDRLDGMYTLTKDAVNNYTLTQPTDTTGKLQHTNNTMTAPKTGDESSVSLWIVLALLSGTGVVAMIVLGKRKK